MPSNKLLYELQELDWDVAAHEKSLAEVRAKLVDDSALLAAKEMLERLDAELSQLVIERRRVELSVRALQEKLQAVEGRLYGGTVTNPRELAANEDERSFLQGQQATEEDELLELMVEIEDRESARKDAQERLAQLEAAREVEHPELQVEERRLTAGLDRLRRARSDMTPQLPASDLSVYESLRKTRSGHAVAKVVRGACQGCRISLPTMELQRVRTSQDIVRCSICYRILYVV